MTNLALDTTGPSLSRAAWSMLGPSLPGLVIVMAVALLVGVTLNFAQVGFVLSAEPMNPNLSKINPLSGLKRLLSARSAFEGFKAIFKTTVFGIIAWTSVASSWPQLMALGWSAPLGAISSAGGLVHGIVLKIAIAWLILAVGDYLFQRKQTDKQLRMTKDELKREMKESETSPELKMAQMQRRRKMKRNSLMDALAKADVVITNPTHYAVAVQYEAGKQHAPVVVAKGVDHLAARIRELAKERKVPLVPNPPLARALYRKCEVGDFVPRDLFQPVAEVLAYVYKTIKKVRGA
jgi:flagellar biosynthesis protein FlhB